MELAGAGQEVQRLYEGPSSYGMLPLWDEARLAEELRHRRGSQFDPEVADVALRLLERGELPLPAREAAS